MKQFLVTLSLLAVLSTSLYAESENIAVWEQMYQQARSDEQRVTIVLKIAEFRDERFAPLMLDALDALVASGLNVLESNAQKYKNELGKLLVQELGNAKYILAADSVFLLYKEAKDSLLKAEAAIALGKMRAVGFAVRLARDLTDMNQLPQAEELRNREIQAFGLVQALGTMRDPAGFEAVFIAAYKGWYSNGSNVKETAKAFCLTMVDDPSAAVLKIIEQNQSVMIQSKALEVALQSKAESDKKNNLARRTLAIGIERIADNKLEFTEVSTMRQMAMDGLIRNKDKDPASITLLQNLINMDQNNDTTRDETIKAYYAVGVNASEVAIKYLIERLSFYNSRQMSKANNARDKLIVRQIIASMAITGSKLVKDTLNLTLSISSYDAAILREARELLAKLN